MEINLTLVGQLITFAIVVWFTMHYIWPPLTKALTERQKQISEGLIAAEEAVKDRDRAKEEALQIIANAKMEASQMIEQSQKRGSALVAHARTEAIAEGQRLLEAAKSEISREKNAAKDQLRTQIAQLAVAGAEKILKREISVAANQALIDEMMKTQL